MTEPFILALPYGICLSHPHSMMENTAFFSNVSVGGPYGWGALLVPFGTSRIKHQPFPESRPSKEMQQHTLASSLFCGKAGEKRPYLHRLRQCGRCIPWQSIKRKGSYHYEPLKSGGAGQNWTDDLLNAIQALSQLSYNPMYEKVFSEPWNESQPFFSHSPKTASKAPLEDTPSSPPFLRKAES